MRPLYAVAGILNALTLGILLVGPSAAADILCCVGAVQPDGGWMLCAVYGACAAAAGGFGQERWEPVCDRTFAGNAPVVYMTKIDGLGAKWFGLRGLPATDMVVSAGGVAGLFLVWFWWERRRVGQG